MRDMSNKQSTANLHVSRKWIVSFQLSQLPTIENLTHVCHSPSLLKLSLRGDVAPPRLALSSTPGVNLHCLIQQFPTGQNAKYPTTLFFPGHVTLRHDVRWHSGRRNPANLGPNSLKVHPKQCQIDGSSSVLLRACCLLQCVTDAPWRPPRQGRAGCSLSHSFGSRQVSRAPAWTPSLERLHQRTARLDVGFASTRALPRESRRELQQPTWKRRRVEVDLISKKEHRPLPFNRLPAHYRWQAPTMQLVLFLWEWDPLLRNR